MPRVNRHFLAGLVRHITHRCHRRQILLKFRKKHQQWIRWLREFWRQFI